MILPVYSPNSIIHSSNFHILDVSNNAILCTWNIKTPAFLYHAKKSSSILHIQANFIDAIEHHGFFILHSTFLFSSYFPNFHLLLLSFLHLLVLPVLFTLLKVAFYCYGKIILNLFCLSREEWRFMKGCL